MQFLSGRRVYNHLLKRWDRSPRGVFATGSSFRRFLVGLAVVLLPNGQNNTARREIGPAILCSERCLPSAVSQARQAQARGGRAEEDRRATVAMGEELFAMVFVCFQSISTTTSLTWRNLFILLEEPWVEGLTSLTWRKPFDLLT